MRYFEILTRLDPPQLNNPRGARLTTRIRQNGAKEIWNGVELHADLLDAETFSYILDHHMYQIKQFILNEARDQLFKDSPEYQKMKRQLAEAHNKLDDISDIADPDER
jgi:hypothetical protein